MIPLIAKLREDFVNGKIDQSHPAVRTLIDGAAFANWRVCWAASFVTSMVISFVASKILTCSNDPRRRRGQYESRLKARDERAKAPAPSREAWARQRWLGLAEEEEFVPRLET